MKNMFLKNAPRQVLVQRNIILGTVEWCLGIIAIIIDAMVIARYILGSSNPPNPEYRVLALVLTLLFIRFFLWSYWYYYIDVPEDSKDQLSLFRENEETRQRKFFTLRKHKAGERNPLF